MDYIINPWWFYLIGILSTVSFLSVLYFLLSLAAFILTAIWLGSEVDDREEKRNKNGNDDNYKWWQKAFKISTITLVSSIMLLVLVPSEKTMDKMLIASVVTKQNVEAGADFTQDQISKLVDKISDAAVKVKTSNSQGK